MADVLSAKGISTSIGVEFQMVMIFSSASTVLARQSAHDPKCFRAYTSGFRSRLGLYLIDMMSVIYRSAYRCYASILRCIYSKTPWLPRRVCVQTYEQELCTAVADYVCAGIDIAVSQYRRP